MKHKLLNRVLAALLSVMLIFGLLPTTVFANDTVPDGNWSDYAAENFAGGSGTKEDPYQIATAEQLAKLSNDVADGTSYKGMYFKLESNIDLSDHVWSPIGVRIWPSSGNSTSNAFRGFFDGNNCTISGLYVDERTTLNAAGLFGYIVKSDENKDAEVGVKNLTIEDAVIYSNEEGLMVNMAGILVAWAMANPGYSVNFEGITVSGQIITESTNNSNKVGGMAGDATRCVFTDCHVVDVTITGAGNCGGFAGNAVSSSFEYCSTSGTIDGTLAVGGFVGYSVYATLNEATSSFIYCTADVDVTGNLYALGGFAGAAQKSDFKNCAAYGDVTSTVENHTPITGGFIGDNNGSNISQCHAAGTVSAVSNEGPAGGFVGSSTSGTITNCSFDAEKNPTLSASGAGTAGTDGIDAASTNDVLTNICIDIYGGHDYAEEWVIDKEATCTETGSKHKVCNRCGTIDEITEIPATGHNYTNDPTFSWNEDNSKATATFTCTNDKTHTQILEAKVTSTTVDPTTEKEGKITYTATVTFEGKEYADTKEVVLDKLPEEVLPPTIIAGNNSTWNTNSSDGLTFVSDAEYQDFIKVLVDDKEVDAKYYTVKEGSTIVTLSNDFLKTLSVGKHTLSIVSTNGTATANFEVVKGETAVTVPNTGIDVTGTYFLSLSAILSLGIAVTIILKKKYSK